MSCFFCTLTADKVIAANELCVAVRDGYPVSKGHTLVVTKRHVAIWFDATPDEQRAVMALVDGVKAQLDAQYQPDGYNGGFNAGEAAGQTVMNLHVHVIPRYRGDVDDPTGGVRLVVPDKGNYRRPGYLPTSSKRQAAVEGISDHNAYQAVQASSALARACVATSRSASSRSSCSR